jgi:hypothetical protein
MQDAIVPLGTHDDLVAALFQELAPPAWPADGLTPESLALTWQTIRRGQNGEQQGNYHMHPHGSLAFLRRMPQGPRLLCCLDTAVLDEAAVIIIIKGLQWRGD